MSYWKGKYGDRGQRNSIHKVTHYTVIIIWYIICVQLNLVLLNKSNFAELKDQITHLPDNADRSVAKQKFKITNWPTYNKALINRGSITFWLDDEAIQASV